MLRRLPIEPSGWVVVAVGLVTLLGALILNWRELLVIAIGCAVVLAVAIPFVIGRGQLGLERALKPARVQVGDRAVAEITVTNRGSVPTRRGRIHDSFDGSLTGIVVPRLEVGATATVPWDLPTQRRGVYRVGPARIAKSDPCRLLRRDVGHTGVDTFWVHPNHVILPRFAGGLTRDLDGPTSDNSPAGDVAFHAVRQYRNGDDPRHVHWFATARAGELMVRHYVDHRQPSLTVVLDTDDASWGSADEFEIGVEIAASFAVSTIVNSQPLSLYVGPRQVAVAERPASRNQILDELAGVTRLPQGSVARELPRIKAANPNTTLLVMVTGLMDPKELNAATTSLARGTEVLIVRTVAEETERRPVNPSGTVRVLDVAGCSDLAARLRPLAGAR